MEKAALVLEGGALRSFYTMGVLDSFLDNDLEFEYVGGVSGGALCAMNYIAKQRGRTVDINLHFLEDKRYKSMKNLIKNRAFFNIEFLFSKDVETYTSFDYSSYTNSQQVFELAATNCISGESEFKRHPNRREFNWIVASASIPFASKEVIIEGIPYLDGGISEPVPYHRAASLGYDKVVVVLTRDASYQKLETRDISRRIIRTVYGKYPHFVRKMIERPETYNKIKREIEALYQAGKIMVIQPQEPVKVSRFEQDKQKLWNLYQQGIKDANQKMETIKTYLKTDSQIKL